jgi:2-oxo-4-hydroxy-4-carboxy-5-ureidoimidazoline decarboxylase
MEAGAFVALLGGVFEHAAWVAQAVAPQRPFASTADLHAAMLRILQAAPADVQLAFLNGHPELAGPEARARSLTADSASEQGSAGLDRMAESDAAAFTRLNAAYRARFGFPFIVAVRGRGQAEILSVFEARLGRDPAAERETALEEVAQITRMRLDRLIDA